METKTGRRINDHKNMQSLRHPQPKARQVVDYAIKKYGWANCQWRYLAINCTNEDGWALERFFIKQMRLQDEKWGYNINAGGNNGRLGVVASQTQRDKQSVTMKARAAAFGVAYLHTPKANAKRTAILRANGVYDNEENKVRLRQLAKTRPSRKGVKKAIGPDGKAHFYTEAQIKELGLILPPKSVKRPRTTTHLLTPEVIAKRVATRRASGHPWNNTETNQKISETKQKNPRPSWNKGVPMSEESKQKLSRSKKGQIPPNKGARMSDTMRRHLSEVNRGKPAHNKGVPMSEEQKRKVSASKMGRIMLPAGPNGEMRAFRAEQLI